MTVETKNLRQYLAAQPAGHTVQSAYSLAQRYNVRQETARSILTENRYLKLPDNSGWMKEVDPYTAILLELQDIRRLLQHS